MSLENFVLSYGRGTCAPWTGSRSGWTETPVIEKQRKLRHSETHALQAPGGKDIHLDKTTAWPDRFARAEQMSKSLGPFG